MKNKSVKSDETKKLYKTENDIAKPLRVKLNALFDQVASSVVLYSDTIAERVVQLGGIAEGTVRIVATRSKLPEYPLNIGQGRMHVHAVATALATFGAEVRASIPEAVKLDDADTADLFTEVTRGIDKWLWFIEAHIQTE